MSATHARRRASSASSATCLARAMAPAASARRNTLSLLPRRRARETSQNPFRRQRHLGYPEHGIRGPGEAPRRQERARGGFLTEGWTRFPGEGVPRAARVLRRAQRGRGGPSQADVRRVSEKANETKRTGSARARSTLHDGRSRTPPVIRWKRAAPMRFRATARVRTKTMTKRADGRVRCIWGDSLCNTSRSRRVKRKNTLRRSVPSVASSLRSYAFGYVSSASGAAIRLSATIGDLARRRRARRARRARRSPAGKGVSGKEAETRVSPPSREKGRRSRVRLFPGARRRRRRSVVMYNHLPPASRSSGSPGNNPDVQI